MIEYIALEQRERKHYRLEGCFALYHDIFSFLVAPLV